VRIYLASGATDMRRGFDSFSVMAQKVLKQDGHSPRPARLLVPQV
jgi:transposase